MIRPGRSAGLMLGVFFLGMTSCSLPGKAIRTAKSLVQTAEKVAKGDPGAIFPLLVDVLNAAQDFGVLSRDETSVVAEVRSIAGLGELARSAEAAYYLRAELLKAADTTRLVMSFFKSARGHVEKILEPDSVVSGGASKLFAHIFAALLKSGVAFK